MSLTLMHRNGGRYWRALVFRFLVTWTITIPLVLVLLIALVNPFWFRTSLLKCLITLTEQLTEWRNYKVYWIYLGMDPKVWYALTEP